ncbi:hypothetical protein, partial [Proteus faecis]|uniref:hypothetical protein n=1 Tax=Proteus faecis TaxID=2050967 RepID=UPI003512EA72
ITRRRSSQIAGTLASLSPVGASLRQLKHWQCCIMQRYNTINLIKLCFFVNTEKREYFPLFCLLSDTKISYMLNLLLQRKNKFNYQPINNLSLRLLSQTQCHEQFLCFLVVYI